MNSEESRLGRWARRKAEVRRGRGSATPEPLKESAAPELPAKTAKVEEGAETLPEGLDLPDIDSLTAESDFSVFMKEGVPPALRRLALQKLWSSDPMFNIIDEMVEYGEDYNKLAVFTEGVTSAWRPGRGYARDEEDDEAPAGAQAGDVDEDAETAQEAGTEKSIAGAAGEPDGTDPDEALGDEDAELG